MQRKEQKGQGTKTGKFDFKEKPCWGVCMFFLLKSNAGGH